ncbi:PAS domain S-box protein [Uliginosibacterium sp. sgz301328]|uniref:PAS domain-containing sensor histidine kinase n=1 Tax=Uliginosibacterium sp. sgz301328 TaxID=3243764 RepID=UPI00359EF312
MDPNLRTNRSHFSLSASPLTYIGIGLIGVLVFIWYHELPAGVRADIMRVLPSMLLTLLVGVGVWSLWVSRERSLRVEAVESERDQIFSLSLDILCVLTMDGRFRRTNPAFLNVLGQRPDQLLEKAFTEIVHPDDMHLVLGIFKSLALGRQASFEIRCRCGDGTYNWLSWSANPIPHEGLIYAAAHDISARRNAEDALRAETAFRKAMEESVSAGLQAIDLKGRIIYVNRAFCEMVDRRAQDLIGTEPPFPYWHASELDLQWHNLALCLSGKTPRDGFDARVLRRDESEITVRMQVSPLVNSLGVQTGWMMAMTDITESRRVRAELEASHERFTAVLDGLDAAVFVTDAQTDEVLYANRAFRSDEGGARELSAHQWPVPRPELGDYSLDPRRVDSSMLPYELFDGELQHPISGHWYHLRERATRWVDGRIVRLVVATDISDIKKVEEFSREQEARLQRTSRLVTMGEMASTLAHELNQPLSAIANYSKGCVNRIKTGEFRTEDILGAMEKANAQAARAGHIIRRVRDFVRKSEPKRSGVSLIEVAEDALGIAEIEAQRLGVKIITSIPPTLPRVYADRIMVEQVLLNLIKNGAEAEEGQPPERRIVTVEARQVSEMVEVSVTDNGYGISPENLEKLFSAFFSTKSEGMGMGLNICRSIIEFHNGRLWVDPNPTGGSIFRFTLPLETSIEHQPAHA